MRDQQPSTSRDQAVTTFAGSNTANHTEQKFSDGEMKIDYSYRKIEGLTTSRKLKTVTWKMKRHALDVLTI